MHKKPFIAVLALGLLLLANVAVFANVVPSEIPVRAFGSGQSKSGLSPTVTQETGTLVSINAGTNRTVPGTFCTGQWQGAYTYSVGNWYVGNEFYAAYQDPSTPTWWNGTCSNTPSFDVTAINTIDRFTAGPFPKTFVFQPLVFGVASTAECAIAPAPVAGGALCTGPLYAVTWSASASFLINLPFPVECCQSGPFFAAWYGPTAGALRVGCNAGLAAPVPTTCGTFNEYGSGWDELSKYFTFASPGPYNLEKELYAEGYTPDDPATHCTPGNCVTDLWYDPATAPTNGFGLPSGSGGGRDRLGEWDEANGLDTLRTVAFAMNGGSVATQADLYLEIYLATTPGACNGLMPGVSDSPVYTETIPGSAWAPGTWTSWTLATPFVWGTLNGGPTQRIVVALGAVPGTGSTTGLYANNNSGACTATSHFTARYPVLGLWQNPFPVSAIAPELFMEFGICREQLPAIEADCSGPGTDSWRHFAHDQQLTSASHINVGDPNGAILRWTQGLPEAANFDCPSVAGDIVYISSDKQLSAFNLITGAAVGTLNGLPEMGSSNRGNTTVAFIAALGRDVVYATGGNFNGITALETNLESSPKIWSFNPGTHPPGGLGITGPSYLDGQVRFNASTVLNIGGTDVLFVETEPASGFGRLWALNAATGALYPGWAINPIQLDQCARNGPSTDGTYLYLGTALISNTGPGSLYKIDASNGNVIWQYTEINGEGFGSGASVEGNFLYAVSSGATTGHHYKFDKSSNVAPSVVWSSLQPLGLYGTPTIGRKFVYFPLDGGSGGILQVSKDLGLTSRNFAGVDICGAAVGQVPTILTLSCDDYLFAGDRNSKWWLFNTETGAAEWYRDFGLPGAGIVQGTALATASTGAKYAVVALRSSPITGFGQVSAYQLDAGPRPRMIQCAYDTSISVPFGTLSGNPASKLGVFENIGTAPLNFTALNILDPLPDGLAASVTNFRHTMSLRQRLMPATDDMSATDVTLTKRQRLAGITSDRVDGEWNASDYNTIMNMTAMASSKTRTSSRLAAGAATIRTSNVQLNGSAIPYALAAGNSADLTWDYDGTGLGRGQDLNVMEFTTDDPDFNFDAVDNGSISYADYSVLYVGGCLLAADTVHFNNDGSYETVYNNGGLGDDAATATEFGFEADANTPNADFFDATLILAGDSVGGGAVPDFGAQWFASYYGTKCDRFLPDVSPISGQCGVDILRNQLVGQKRDGGCPGTPVDIFGDKSYTEFVDSALEATAGSPGSAIGVIVSQTEVTAYDPLYGDFKLIHWKVQNRDGVAKGPIYAATDCDWDVNSGTDNGIVSDVFDGYSIWDPATPTIAYGFMNANQPSLYSGVDPSADSPYRIAVYSNPVRVYDPAPWDMGNANKLQTTWSQLVHETPFRIVDAGQPQDVSGILCNKPLMLPANGSFELTQAVYGVDASSNTAATIEANAAAVAKRVARWSGYARGDVNDDGFVDLADVCWLQGANPIYPAAYSGDVNNDGLNNGADVAQLLSFVSGNMGSQPVGAWRF
jgi:hypothetical protein